MISVIIKDAIYNACFTDVDTNQIVDEIRCNGYFAFEQALHEEYINQLLRAINFNQILVNTNDVGVVKAAEIRFLTHCLASSRETYDIITSSKVLDICKKIFTDTFRLTNHRIYETNKRSAMPWHTDNNLQDGNNLSEKHAMPGLLFLIYLTDVDKNAFQFIKDSHKWSQKYDNEIYLSESYVEKNYDKDIRTFTMKKGSIIICNTHGIHRAQPFYDKNYKRITLLFQVDQVGRGHAGHGEKNIVNTEYLENVTPEVMDYLGFGFKRDYPAFPNTSITTMTFKDVLMLQNRLLSKLLIVTTRSLIKSLLPSNILINIKQLRWRLRQKGIKKLSDD